MICVRTHVNGTPDCTFRLPAVYRIPELCRPDLRRFKKPGIAESSLSDPDFILNYR